MTNTENCLLVFMEYIIGNLLCMKLFKMYREFFFNVKRKEIYSGAYMYTFINNSHLEICTRKVIERNMYEDASLSTTSS